MIWWVTWIGSFDKSTFSYASMAVVSTELHNGKTDVRNAGEPIRTRWKGARTLQRTGIRVHRKPISQITSRSLLSFDQFQERRKSTTESKSRGIKNLFRTSPFPGERSSPSNNWKTAAMLMRTSLKIISDGGTSSSPSTSPSGTPTR